MRRVVPLQETRRAKSCRRSPGPGKLLKLSGTFSFYTSLKRFIDVSVACEYYLLPMILCVLLVRNFLHHFRVLIKLSCSEDRTLVVDAFAVFLMFNFRPLTISGHNLSPRRRDARPQTQFFIPWKSRRRRAKLTSPNDFRVNHATNGNE